MRFELNGSDPHSPTGLLRQPNRLERSCFHYVSDNISSPTRIRSVTTLRELHPAENIISSFSLLNNFYPCFLKDDPNWREAISLLSHYALTKVTTFPKELYIMKFLQELPRLMLGAFILFREIIIAHATDNYKTNLRYGSKRVEKYLKQIL